MDNRVLRRLVSVTAALMLIAGGGLPAQAAVPVGNQSENASAPPCNGTFALTEGPVQQTSLTGPNPKVTTLTARIDVWCYIVIGPTGTGYGASSVNFEASITGPPLMGKDCVQPGWISTGGFFNGYVGSMSCSVNLSGPADVGQFTASQYFTYNATPALGAVLTPGCYVTSAGWSPFTRCDSVLSTYVLPPS